MGSFAAMFGTQANTPIGRIGGAQVGNGSAPNALNIPSTNIPKASGRGLLGALYNTLIQPVANSVSGGLGDALKIPAAIGGLGKIGAAEVTGNKTALTNDLAAQNQLLNSTNFRQNYEDPNLEKALGKSTGQILNIAGPAAGGEELSGAKGLLSGAKAGAGIGAKLGALGGIANTAAQGSTNLGQFAGNTATGLAEGAGIGALGGGVSGTIGRVAGRSADQAGAGADAAVGNKPTGFMGKTAAKAGARVANEQKAQASIDFSGDANNAATRIVGHDKQGNTVGINSVQGFLRGVKMNQDATAMQTLSNVSNRTLAPDLKSMTDGINIDASGANQVGTDSVVSHGLGVSKNLNSGSHADIAQRAINDATDKLGPQSTVSDVLDARQKLTSAKATSDMTTKAGDLPGAAVSQSYQDTIDHLDSKLNSAGVNKAVANHTVSPEGEDRIRQIVDGEGGSPQLADHIIKAENNAQTYQDMISEQQIPTLAGHLSKLAKDTFEAAPTKLDKSTGQPEVPSWYLASAARGDPTGVLAVAAKLGEKTHPIQTTAKMLNPTAFAAARDRAMAIDPVTQEKLDMPGVGGGPVATGGTPPPPEDVVANGAHPLLTRQTPASSMEGRRGEAMHPAPPMSTEAATQPAQTAPPTPQASSVQEPTGVPVQGDMTQNPTAPPVAPQEAQPIGIRANANPSPGPEVNGISGPIPNSGATMGAEPGAQQPVPVSSPTQAQNVPTTPMQTSNVPVQAQGTGQANGEVPTQTAPPTPPPSALDNLLNTVTGGAHAVGQGVSAADDFARSIPNRVATARANSPEIPIPSASRAISRVGGAVASRPGLQSLVGALTGAGASSAGQNAQDLIQARKGSGSVTAATDPNIPTKFVSSAGSSQSGNANPNSVYPQSQELADIMADPTHASTYETLYKDINPAPTAAVATGAQAIEDASTYIDTIEQQLNGFGGVNQMSGLLADIPFVGPHLEPQVVAYDKTKNDAATALAKALTGKSPSGAQVSQFANSLPNITDTPEVAAQKLDNIRQELANKAGDYGLVAAQ